VALLPPIPDRPADRPETWAEYLSRRAIVAMHRQLLDEIAAFVVDAPPFTVGDVVKNFGRFAAGYEFKRTEAAAVVEFLAVTAATMLIDEDVTWRGSPLSGVPAGEAVNTVLIDEDVTWREDAVRRLLADPLLSLAYARGLQILNGE
jgi:hypothetical protein